MREELARHPERSKAARVILSPAQRGEGSREILRRPAPRQRSAAGRSGTPQDDAGRQIASPATSGGTQNDGSEDRGALRADTRSAPTFGFEVRAKDLQTHARTAVVQTPHGSFHTPAFMPVGTQGAVKGLTPRDLEGLGAEIVLANAYHLSIRPGIEIIREAGGLHRFMGWSGPILTDSGGYQIFSLGRGMTSVGATRRVAPAISDEGVRFQSHFDGREIFLTPERVIEIQEALGSDVAMIFDECPPYSQDRKKIKDSLELTLQWSKRAKVRHQRKDQALFGIIQGGIFDDLREESLARTVALDFDGYALGGVFVGEPREDSLRILSRVAPQMPAERPRYLMGAGTPLELLESIASGVDLFDCVNPTRYGRNGAAFTAKGLVVLRNGKYNRDFKPVEESCRCYTCQNFSRSYLRHLFNTEEMLGPQLASLHNVHFFLEFMRQIQQAIRAGTFLSFKRNFESQFDRNQR